MNDINRISEKQRRNAKKTHVFLPRIFLGAFDLGLDDLNKALIGARRGEAQSRDEASPAQRVGEFALLGGESAGDHAAEGSRGSDGSDHKRKYRRGGPAEHGVRRHLVALRLLVRVLEEGFGAIA